MAEMIERVLPVQLPMVSGGWDSQTRFEVISVWGEGNHGRDHWGWPGMAPCRWQNFQRDPDACTASVDIVISYDPDVSDSEHFAVILRMWHDEDYDVFCKYFDISKEKLIKKILGGGLSGVKSGVKMRGVTST